MNFDLSRIDAKIKKLEQWKRVLDEMYGDPEGRIIIEDLLNSANGNHNAKAPTVVARARKKPTKKAKLEAAILEACEKFSGPFGSRELLNSLLSQNFKFSRRDPMVELGSGLRWLLKENKIRVVREKIGRAGREYERVAQHFA
ncbi:hypothetical protein SBA2_450034 [Acidobacteriia bacterium SbA2]|nr:hypothetical protein SBA2_450034 [Acidobacteriia bacterium SbA2]